MKLQNLIHILMGIVCIGLLPSAQAVLPPPDGCYPGFTTAEGCQTLQNLTTGSGNTGVGWRSLFSVGDGSFNTGVGAGALVLNTNDNNTAVGAVALLLNTTGSDNTAVGTAALETNSTDGGNTAVGAFALLANTAGLTSVEGPNTAVGLNALIGNTTGNGNVAVGATELAGEGVLGANTTGSANTGVGQHVLRANIDGVGNTAAGAASLLTNVSGSLNTAVGVQAGFNITGSGNVCIGQGVLGLAGESNTTRIRNIYSSVASGRSVYVNSDNKIGTLASTRRVKKAIKPMDNASEAVLALKPVCFRYKKEIDASGTLQFGLVAEEVADINADLVTRDSEGKPETVRYEAVNAMLLNEFLKEHRKNEEQGRDIQEQKATIALQQKQIDALTAGLQKVSAQIEASKPAPQVVNNP